MFWAKNFSCFNKSQGNSCTVNDWDTWFYSAYVVASKLPGSQSCWLLSEVCYKNVSVAPRLTMWSTWHCASWLNGQLLIIASSRRPLLSGICDCMLAFALPVDILSIVCSDIIHSSCDKYCVTPICFIFGKFICLSFALSKNYDSLDKFIGNVEYF